jgi:hypothetical protein
MNGAGSVIHSQNQNLHPTTNSMVPRIQANLHHPSYSNMVVVSNSAGSVSNSNVIASAALQGGNA